MYSIVVPTFNRGRLIAATLDSLLAQDTDLPYEIIVVDNNSSDDTQSVVQAYEAASGGRLRYVFEGEQGSSAARNAGIATARGEIIAFVDDDVIAHRNWLQVLADTYRGHPDAWCVGGKVTLRLPDALPPWFDPSPGIMTVYLSLQDLGEETVRLSYPRGLISANMAVTREALSHVGAFDTHLGRFGSQLLCGEDIELCRRIHRAGGGVYYCGKAVVVHLVPDSRITRRFLRQRAYWEGRTVGLFFPRGNRTPVVRQLASEGLVIAKDWVKALIHHGTRNSRRALEHELAARKRLGYLHQTLLPRGALGQLAAGRRSAPSGLPLQIKVTTDAQALEAIAGPWAELAERAGHSIFQSYEWQAAWWRFLSEGRSLYTITAWLRDDLVGIVPLFLESASVGGLRLLERLRFIGCTDSDYLDLIVEPGLEERVAEAVAEHLCARATWDVLELDDVPEQSRSIGPFALALTRRGCQIHRAQHHRCFAIGLPATPEEYTTRLKGRTQRNLRRESRKLFDMGFEVEVVSEGASIMQSMDAFIALHEHRWAAKGQQGVFSDPRRRALHRHVADLFHRRGWLHLAFLSLDGLRVAAEYAFVHGNKAYAYLLGLNPDPRWAKYSPGTVLMMDSIQRAIALGLTEYDLLRGPERYKTTLKATGTVNWRYEIIPPRPAAVLRARVRRALRRMLALGRSLQGKVRRLMRGEGWRR